MRKATLNVSTLLQVPSCQHKGLPQFAGQLKSPMNISCALINVLRKIKVKEKTEHVPCTTPSRHWTPLNFEATIVIKSADQSREFDMLDAGNLPCGPNSPCVGLQQCTVQWARKPHTDIHIGRHPPRKDKWGTTTSVKLVVFFLWLVSADCLCLQVTSIPQYQWLYCRGKDNIQFRRHKTESKT